ncbi:hypothetical protein MMC07_007274, partial [Pseudocyphellaria aurata]|nr:hypothetical protein [Pseudocyphellaria aurata]
MPLSSAKSIDPASNSSPKHLTADITEPKPPWKRLEKPFESQDAANAVYWDSLSKIYLTRPALKEFDCRIRKTIGISRPIPTRPDLSEASTALKHFSRQTKRFARQGGPELSDLRVFPEPTASTSAAHAVSSVVPTAETSQKNVSAYHEDFVQHLIDNGIYPLFHAKRKRPRNKSEIKRTVTRRRPSVTSQFSPEQFKALRIKYRKCLDGEVVMPGLLATIAGKSDNHFASDLLFENLTPLTNGVLVDPKPDFYDGVHPRQIENRLREELNSYITPSTNPCAPVLPNFFVEIKGSNTLANQRQAWYGGVLGARGFQKLRSFEAGDVEPFDEKAYTITCTIHDGILRLFAVHATPSIHPEKPEYHMAKIGAWFLSNSLDGFWDAVSAFRNARDWARAQRDKLVTAANRRMVDRLTIPMNRLSEAACLLETVDPPAKTVDLLEAVDPPAKTADRLSVAACILAKAVTS